MIQYIIQIVICICIIAIGYYSYHYSYTFEDTVRKQMPTNDSINDIETLYFNINRMYTIGITIFACFVVLFTPFVAKKYFHDSMRQLRALF